MKISLQSYGPDALVMLVQHPGSGELFMVMSGPGPGRRGGTPQSIPDQRLVDAYRENGQLVEVLHTLNPGAAKFCPGSFGWCSPRAGPARI